MNRREFIKDMAIAAGGVAGAVVLGGSVLTAAETSKGKGKKKMKILVLTGSPRKNGNSATLADHFIKGAKEAGHEVVRFDAAFKKVHPCIACNSCGMNGPCVFKDDFEFVREHIIGADCVVFATPMYYFGISAQLKAVIDRFYAINGSIHVPKKAVLLMTYANTAASEAVPIKSHYDVLLKYLGWTDAGQIVAPGVWPAGAIRNTPFPEQAYRLGKSL
jgi:multimeric flavodoxin WrbA